MKITFNLFQFFLIALAISTIKSSHNKTDLIVTSNNSQGSKYNLTIEPNVHDVRNSIHLVKPMIETPFIPETIDNVNAATAEKEQHMLEAHILGNEPSSGKTDQKPNIWDNVFVGHKTSVKHLKNDPIAIGIHPIPEQHQDELLKLSNLETPYIRGKGRKDQLLTSITQPKSNEKIGDFGNLETPTFIHKKDKQINIEQALIVRPNGEKSTYEAVHGTPIPPHYDPTSTIVRAVPSKLMDALEASNPDSMEYARNLVVGQTKEEKIQTLAEGRNRILTEIKKLQDKVIEDVVDIGKSKELASVMNVILSHYQKRVDESKNHRLSQEEQDSLREEFKKFALKNLHGYRTTPAEFKSLPKIGEEEINALFSKIQKEVETKN